MLHNEEVVSPPSTHVFLPPTQFWFGLDEEEQEEDERTMVDLQVASAVETRRVWRIVGSRCAFGAWSEELKRQVRYPKERGLRPGPTMPRKPCHWPHEN
eukprot:scaffold87510_cov47-Attheya_sp.AAC.4